MVLPGPLAWDPPLGDQDHRWRGWALVAGVLVLAAIVGLFIRLPYDVISPGETRRVNDLMKVTGGAKVFTPRGQFLYTTVSVREGVNLYEALAGWLSSVDQVESEKVIRGPLPQKVYDQLNRDLMADSKRAAEVVALGHLGYKVAQGAQIVSVDPAFPGAAALQHDDVITEVDGKPISTAEDLVGVIRARKQGDHMRVRATRAGAPRDVDVTVGGQADRPMVGVRVSTFVKLPFDVAIDSGDVVGPSAGLAYALGLYDLLTPGELTKGVKVAATGELGLDGKVQPIGGMFQKTVSVRRSGASVLLVPRANYAEARRHSGKHLRVYAIDDFDSALRALNAFKGDKTSR